MRLRILIPTRVLLDREVSKVTGEALDGLFTLLDRHIDYMASLVPGLLTYEDDDGEHIVAIDEGLLVKQGPETWVSCRNALEGPAAEELVEAIEQRFEKLNEQERQARTAMARMEAQFVRNLLQSERHD